MRRRRLMHAVHLTARKCRKDRGRHRRENTIRKQKEQREYFLFDVILCKEPVCLDFSLKTFASVCNIVCYERAASWRTRVST